MKEFLIFILTVLVIYYGGKLFFRYLLPWLIVHYFKKQSDKFMGGMNGFDDNNTKEGDVSVKKGTSKTSKSDDKEFGEYIDFEEIDENE